MIMCDIHQSLVKTFQFSFILLCLSTSSSRAQQPLGEYWETAEEESKYYEIVEIPLPEETALEAGSFEVLPDNRLAIGTRRGNIYLIEGAFAENPKPKYHIYASGLDEIFGMSYKDGSFFITQQTEVTKITDTDGDERADPNTDGGQRRQRFVEFFHRRRWYRRGLRSRSLWHDGAEWPMHSARSCTPTWMLFSCRSNCGGVRT